MEAKPTERLYYTDSFVRRFEAQIVATADDGRLVYLDRTALYPASGGQPSDTGRIGAAPVVDVIDEGDRIAHRLAEPVTGATGAVVDCAVDWQRRFDHMQQHTGQHLLSSVFADRLGWETVSFHMGAELCTIDLGTGSADSSKMAEAEWEANDRIWQSLPVSITFEDAATAQGLRKASDRSGTIRVITIEGTDRSACGGTHVASTGQIGSIRIRGHERIRDTLRLYFVCGGRALRYSRTDYEALSNAAKLLGAGLDTVPERLAVLLRRAEESDKARRKQGSELARLRSEELYRALTPNTAGIRYVRRTGELDDVGKAEAQAFAAQPQTVYLLLQPEPPALLLACSPDSAIHAGNIVKGIVQSAGGRGGGSQGLAQGSVPQDRWADAAAAIEAALQSAFAGAPRV